MDQTVYITWCKCMKEKDEIFIYGTLSTDIE